MQTLHAHGVTVEDLCQYKHDQLNSVDLINTDLVKAGDIASVLVCTEDQICQAVIEILCFERGDAKKQLTAVDIDDLENHDSRITVQCQILRVVPSKSSTTKPVNWQWTGEYIHFGAKSLQEGSTSCQFVLWVPGKFVHPLAPSIITVDRQRDIDENDSHKSFTTWSIADNQLQETLEYAWTTLCPDTEEIISNIEMLPSMAYTELPYCDTLGN